jgi:hypothetical protein
MVEIKTVEMTRRIRDAHYAELADKTPEERIAFYRERAKALHAELGRSEELPPSHAERRSSKLPHIG